MEAEKSQKEVTRIWLADDHKDFREALQDILNGTDGLRCDRIFASCEEVIETILHEPTPDVLLMDVNFPNHMSGLEGVRIIRAQAPEVRVLMLSMHLEDDIIFEALLAGAHGFVFKMSTLEKILDAIASTRAGIIDISPEIAQRILDVLHPASSRQDRQIMLNQHELEILTAFIQGLSKQKIAERLRLSSTIVERHLQSIFRKLHLL